MRGFSVHRRFAAALVFTMLCTLVLPGEVAAEPVAYGGEARIAASVDRGLGAVRHLSPVRRAVS